MFKDEDETLDRVAEDEPIFVLRAQDASAPATILFWLIQNPHLQATAKGMSAANTAFQMKAWQRENPARFKAAD